MNAPRFPVVLLPMLLLGAGTALITPGGSHEWVGTIPSSAVVSCGEELVYEVSWTFFKLGTIRLQTKGDFTAAAHVDSYENLPLVDLHAVHYTRMDSSFYSRGSRSAERKEDGWHGLDYLYDLPAHRLTMQETIQDAPESEPRTRTTVNTLQLPDTCFLDGLSIAYFPRRFIHTGTPVSVPTVLYGKVGTTTFDFSNRKTTVSIDAVDEDVLAIRVDGTTTVEGIFGMSGDFSGWFSDDSAAVPLKGRLKVLLGEVDVELIKWNRQGWKPPTE